MNGRITAEWLNRGRSVEQRGSGTGETVKLNPIVVRKTLKVLPRFRHRKAGMSIGSPVRRRPTAYFGWQRLMRDIQPFWDRSFQSFESIVAILLELKTPVGAWTVLLTQDWMATSEKV